MNYKAQILAVALAFSTHLVAVATIVSFSGVTPLGGPPAPNVLPGSQPPLPTPIIFPEFINGAIPLGGVPVDHDGSVVSASPVTDRNVVSPLLVASAIPVGTKVDSYLFHFDPADAAAPADHVYPSSSVLFDQKIVGVQLFSSAAPLQKPALTPYVGTLEAGDAVSTFNGGPAPAYYPGGLSTRGMEPDSMAITNEGFGISLGGQAFGNEIDQLRIYTAAVPEPSAFLLAVTAVPAFVFRRRPL